jgi:hypothetical protein
MITLTKHTVAKIKRSNLYRCSSLALSAGNQAYIDMSWFNVPTQGEPR